MPQIAQGLVPSSGQDLLARADAVLTGGALGFFKLPDEVNVVVRSGSGGRVTDVDGREFIDYVLGSGPMLVGHANPEIASAVEEQLRRGSTYYFLNEPAIRLAERLIEAIPCADEVRFMGSGTEATYLALPCARAHSGRSKILKFEGGWHGMHDYALWGTVPAEPSDYPHALPDSTGIPDVLGNEVLVAPFNDTELAVQIIERYGESLAAVIVEPLERILVPQPGFLEAVRDAAARCGAVLIFDEVVTGFRLAWGGAQERYGITPDLATYGKAMAGGFALSAIVGREEIMREFDGGRHEITEIVWATGTFSGNPIAATAGLAALDILEQPGVYDNLHRIGSRLRAGIVEAGRGYGIPVQALGEDAVFGVRFIENESVTTWMDLQEMARWSHPQLQFLTRSGAK
ncbi:MAG: aminotransferase class III-fold pyridoxal phosphate-dependent enzyme [Nitrospinae bacterium]|nr:aminotransferase class III-fold pyridoxal phosphate-dependent enzyme [Nitrospinota bacterium]